jgi:glucan 1,3-beta-glucosidase
MKFAAAALVSLGLSGAHALVDIPAVSSVVSSALSEYSIYVTHALNPTATATKTPAKATNNVDILARGAVSDPAYWLAGISHRGVAAFNSNPSTYTVFRNVKDYGAKGMSPIKIVCKDCGLILKHSQVMV